MIDFTSTTEASSNSLAMRLGEGATAYNMGEGVVAIDQRDDSTGLIHRVIVTEEGREAVLAWEPGAKTLTLDLDGLTASLVAENLWALNQYDVQTEETQRVMVTREDMIFMRNAADY